MSTVLQLADLSLTLGGRTLFDDLSLQIDQGDRIGLVGPNGSGKSSLFRILAGQSEPDGGSLHKRDEIRIGYLPQEVGGVGDAPVLELVLDSVPDRVRVSEELERLTKKLSALQKADADPDAMTEAAARVADAHHRLAEIESRFSEYEAKKILHGLGFRESDLSRSMTEFSGGWKMRAVLASLLFQCPDLLLLDEPTNHLDMPSVAWLSGFLERYPQAFILVSHDREFLNEEVNRIVSFEPEGVRSFRGNYEQYLRRREEERTVLENRAKNLAKERAHLEQFVDRFRAKASKAAQVQSRIRALDKMETVELQQRTQSAHFQFPPAERGPRVPIRTEGLGVSYGSHAVLKDVSINVDRGDRIAIVGPNGAGKTTLLKVLAGELCATEGKVQRAERAELRYYAQHHADALHPSHSVYDEVARSSELSSNQQVRAVLGAMLFREIDLSKQVAVLSGGERARVALAKILVRPGNVLLMDEPTNHLDLQTSESLTDALESFEGTLVFVSHNRAFIRQLATRLWVVDKGGVEAYAGNFDDYLWSCRDTGASSILQGPAPAPAAGETQRGRDTRKDQKRREAELRAAKSKRLKPLKSLTEKLERQISELEEAQARRNEVLSDPSLYEDAGRRDELLREFSAAQAELDQTWEKWTLTQQELEEAQAEFEKTA